MTDEGQIVPASHADSLRLTRPDGTALQIPASCLLAIDRILHECAESDWYLKVSPCDNVTGGWWARLTFATTTIGGEPADIPWQAVLSLAEKLKEATPVTTPAVPAPGETLYRRKPNGRYEAVSYQIDTFYRFPQGRWVLTVDGSSSCWLRPLPNTDEALFAALQKFRWVLADAIAKHSRASVGGELTKKQMADIRDIAGEALVWFTTEAAGTIALKATEEFERQCLQKKEVTP